MPAGADPDLALRVAKAVADVYGEAAARLLAVVARRLARGIDEPGWAERKLLEIVGLRDDARKILDRLDVLGPEAVEASILEAFEVGAAAAVDELKLDASLAPRTNTRAVDVLVRETVTSVRSTHGQILRSVEDVYRTVIAEVSAPGVVTGTETRRQATQRALDRFAARGITGFRDRSGRNWELESYTEMATRTAAGRAQIAGSLDRYVADGRDLVIVSDHTQECELCRPWEGKILSITGATPAGTRVGGFVVAGTVREAQSAGLQHPNCRHNLAAFVPGLTRPMRGTADPEGDAARQEQRRLERGVRAWKRREAVALDDSARALARAKVREWQTALRSHVDEHGLKRQRQREQVGRAR